MNRTKKNGRGKSFMGKMKMLLGKPVSEQQPPPKPARDRIVERFEKWLDETLAEEKPLTGFDAALLSELESDTDPSVNDSVGNQDDYTTWRAMTALTQEVKLQGRAFRELRSDLAPLSALEDSLVNLVTAHRDAVSDVRGVAEQAHAVLTDQKKDLQMEADRRAKNAVIDVLLDTRERLIIGLKSTEESFRKLESRAAGNRFSRWRSGKKTDFKHLMDIIMSLKKGYRLGLDRVDETIGKWGVVEIQCEGKMFDPGLMTAMDMEERDDISDGTVMEVFRTGYVLDNEILRPAQVKVSRAPVETKEKV